MREIFFHLLFGSLMYALTAYLGVPVGWPPTGSPSFIAAMEK